MEYSLECVNTADSLLKIMWWEFRLQHPNQIHFIYRKVKSSSSQLTTVQDYW